MPSEILPTILPNLFFLSQGRLPKTQTPYIFLFTGTIHTVYSRLCNVMKLATEAKVGDLFIYFQEAICHTFEVMGHHQPPTPVKTDNLTASSTANNTMWQRKTLLWTCASTK